jgi:hypothetical protein
MARRLTRSHPLLIAHRGSLALLFALPLHTNLLSSWSFDAADVALGLQAALPLVALDAALLLPDGPALAQRATDAATDRRVARFARLGGAALAAARADQARYGLAGVGGASLRVALATAAQLSEELLSRGVLFGFAAAWISGRLGEAGLADATVGAGPDAPLLSDAARAAVAGAIVLGAGVRYAQHAAQNVSGGGGQEEDNRLGLPFALCLQHIVAWIDSGNAWPLLGPSAPFHPWRRR